MLAYQIIFRIRIQFGIYRIVHCCHYIQLSPELINVMQPQLKDRVCRGFQLIHYTCTNKEILNTLYGNFKMNINRIFLKNNLDFIYLFEFD